MTTWREISLTAIRAAHAEYDSDDLDGLERHIRNRYPFGARSNYPYKAWCKAVRDYMDDQRKIKGFSALQPSLFETGETT